MFEKVRSIAIVFVLLGLSFGTHQDPCAGWRAYSRRAAVQQVYGIGALLGANGQVPRRTLNSRENSKEGPSLNANSGASY
jgi:hypothetical protein